MSNPFHIAATKAFEDVYIDIVEMLPIELRDKVCTREFKRAFASRMDAACKAFDACTTADKLEEFLETQRAENALTEFIRAWHARKDLSYARERFWAIFSPPTSPRLF